MSTPTSNKRRRIESPVQYEPYDTEDLPSHKDLSDQPWTRYENNPTEAQITDIVQKLDESDVRQFLTKTIESMNESDVRELLINAAVSNELVYIDLWGELTQIQLEKKDEKARKTMQRLSPPTKSTLQGHETQQLAGAKLPKAPAATTSRNLDIEVHVKEVEYIINEQYADLSEWRQYDKAGEAVKLIETEIAKIARRVTKDSRYTTKLGAILGLCQVGTIVARAGSSVGIEVRNQIGNDEMLVRTMLSIADLMTIEEKAGLNNDEIGTLADFDMERMDQAIFHNFYKVITAFEGSFRLVD